MYAIWSFAYVGLCRLLQLVALLCRSKRSKEVEILLLRHERIVEDVRNALEAGRLPWVVAYKRLELPKQSGHYEFHESINRDKQRDLLIQLLKVEAPIHVDYAISRLAQAWGLRRAGQRVQLAGRTAVKMAVGGGAAEQRGDFLWRPGQELEVVREPDWDDGRTFRDISFIPLRRSTWHSRS